MEQSLIPMEYHIIRDEEGEDQLQAIPADSEGDGKSTMAVNQYRGTGDTSKSIRKLYARHSDPCAIFADYSEPKTKIGELTDQIFDQWRFYARCLQKGRCLCSRSITDLYYLRNVKNGILNDWKLLYR